MSVPQHSVAQCEQEITVAYGKMCYGLLLCLWPLYWQYSLCEKHQILESKGSFTQIHTSSYY